MRRSLLISVRFHDGRYHGTGDWPPSPARLFQALVAGTARGDSLGHEERKALTWLETLGAPIIAAPPIRDGQSYRTYVPNNDLDAVGGDPRRAGKIKAPKSIRPRLFYPLHELLYVWRFDADEAASAHARMICKIADRLYQLGRGVDMAWAWGEILDEDEVELRLERHGGALFRPTRGGAGTVLLCPQERSLESLEARFRASRKRFATVKAGTKAQQLFSQPPRPSFAPVAYDSPPHLLLFELRASTPDASFAPWLPTRTADLATRLRDAAAARLKRALPKEAAIVERILVGRGATEADKAARVRIMPLPSIGHSQADRAIRRVLVEVPPDCPIRADDISWAFSGLDLGADYETGEILTGGQAVLTHTDDLTMLDHYGIDAQSPGRRIWRTVTPAALPIARARGRRDGAARLAKEAEAAHAVRQALRHAGVAASTKTIRMQREPFSGKGARAEAFEDGTRFEAARLWHVEIVFAAPVQGPLVIGDGRYCGLGLMEPSKGSFRDILVLPIRHDSRPPVQHRAAMVKAVRRALMSRASDGSGAVSTLFSGHDTGPGPARSGQHRHIYLFAEDRDGDGLLDQIGIIAPWRIDRSWKPSGKDRALFDRVAGGLATVRAGATGVLTLLPGREPADDDPLFMRARTWVSRTSYRPTRHHKRRADGPGAATDDLLQECLRRGLPRPRIEVTSLETGPRGGIRVEARLIFSAGVAGPILLGRDAHEGGGLFAAER